MLFGVEVVLGLPRFPGGLRCGYVKFWSGCVWVVLESAVIGSTSILFGIGSNVEVLGQEVVGASVSKV